MKKLVLILLLNLTLPFLVTNFASAHVLITSDAGDSSMLVHINPDDDPIAGQSTEMFFDIRSNRINKDDYNFYLIISSDRYAPATINLEEVGKSYLRAEMSFPTQGVYKLELVARPTAGFEERFEFNQRVSRGVTLGTDVENEAYEWAEAGLIVSFCLSFVILILIINRRKQILEFTYVGPKKEKKK